MSRRPNLLFLWTDEQRADSLACYGNTVVRAPHLNALAERSFVFENAYCTQPVCTPSRAAILTGQWAHRHGCVQNNTPLPSEAKTIAELVGDNYRCAYYGKWHLGDEIIAQHGFADWVSIEDGMYRPYFSHPEYLERRSDYHHFLLDQGYAPDEQAADGARVFSRNFAAALPEPYTKAGFLGSSAAQFLRDYDDNAPFLLSVNFLEPHMPFFGPLNNLHRQDNLPEGPAFGEAPRASSALRNRLFAAQYAADGLGGYPLRTRAHWRRQRANYYGLVALVDGAVGEILRALEDSGRAENTIIVFTSDHGDMMGDHGLIAKTVMYEEAIRIPLLMHVPWLENRPVRGQISQIDLVPTLLDLMDQPAADQAQGSSRADALRNAASLDDDVVVEWNPDAGLPAGDAPPGFDYHDVEQVSRQSWRTLVGAERIKINVSDDDSNELYDLNLDPFELRNRWSDPEYLGRREDLSARLGLWQKETGDTISLTGV